MRGLWGLVVARKVVSIPVSRGLSSVLTSPAKQQSQPTTFKMSPGSNDETSNQANSNGNPSNDGSLESRGCSPNGLRCEAPKCPDADPKALEAVSKSELCFTVFASALGHMHASLGKHDWTRCLECFKGVFSPCLPVLWEAVVLK